MTDTAISWTHRPGTRGRTWNPVRGCSRVSAGCQRCYAEAQAARIVRMGRGKPTAYDGLVKLVGGEPRWTGEVRLVADRLAEPLRWREPSTVFVNSMSDLFHESLSNEQIAAVFGVMAACPQHVFQVLTKRATRMREWFEWVDGPLHCIQHALMEIGLGGNSGRTLTSVGAANITAWPLLNVWPGVSVEDRKHGLPRINELRRVPAAVRMLSCEPLLEDLGVLDLTGISWLICGAESGPGARPADHAWFRSLRDQCRTAGVAFFVKQLVVDGKLRKDVTEFPVDLQIQEFPQ